MLVRGGRGNFACCSFGDDWFWPNFPRTQMWQRARRSLLRMAG